MSKLLEPYTLNGLTLANRMVMAPMTRTRADDRRLPTELMRDYYVQSELGWTPTRGRKSASTLTSKLPAMCLLGTGSGE